YVPIMLDLNILRVVGFLNQYLSLADLTTFMSTGSHLSRQCGGSVARGYNLSRPHAKVSMNIQYAKTKAYPIKHIFLDIFYSVGGIQEWWSGSNQPVPRDMYLAWFNYVTSQPNLPQMVIISYGDEEQNIPWEYVLAVCNLFLQLSVWGVSVLFTSSNDGVSKLGKGACRDSSGNVLFSPNFPASCPWVTSVSGTTNFDPKAAAKLSRGGYSFHFVWPSYQDGAVIPFLRHIGSQYASSYNPRGHGIPDVSAQALNFMIVLTANLQTMAGIILLLNDFLLSKGWSPLGFLNLWLYSHGLGGFNNITSGSNLGCGTGRFSAINGWDPV
ncbi:peptidase S8/S53 domain-containing protein, partial [Lactarius deliciosus]